MATAGDITRRTVIGAMVAAGLGYTVFGPRRARAIPSGRVVIEYWEKWTGQEAEAMRRIVDEFNQIQDRIWVRYFSMSAIEQKAMIAIAGGDPPDVIGMWNYLIPAFSEADAILPIGPMIDDWGDEVFDRFARFDDSPQLAFDESFFAGPIWDVMRHEDEIWGLVNTCSTLAMVYSRAAFRDAGLDPDRAPRTIAEMDEYADALTLYDDDGNISQAGFIHRDPGWWNWLWGYWFGGSIYDPESNTATAHTPENIRGFEWVRSYPERFGIDRLASFQSGFGNYNSAQQALLAGSVAMTLHGPFLVNVINTFDPGFDYAAAPFPVIDELYDPARPIGMLETDMLYIPKGCKHPREAFEFVCYTQRRAAAEQLAIDHAKPSPFAQPSPDFTSRHPHKYIEVFNSIVQSPRAFPTPLTPVWPQYKDEFDASIGIFWEDMSRAPADVLMQIQERGQRAIDEHAAQRTRRGRA